MQHQLGLDLVRVQPPRTNESRISARRCRFGGVIIAVAHAIFVVSAKSEPVPWGGVKSCAVFTPVVVKIGIANESNLRLLNDSRFGKVPLELADGFLVKT